MTGKELFQEIGNISEEHVVEAERYRKESGGGIVRVGRRRLARSASFRRTLTMAACLVICAGLVFTVQKLGITKDAAEESVVDNEGAVMEMAVAESSVAQNTASGSEKKAEEMETRPETEVDVVQEAAEKEASVITEAEEEEAKTEAGEIVGNQNSGSIKDEMADVEKSESVWDLKSIKEKMAVYPDKYEDILMLEGVYILVHGKVEKGQDIWEAFVQSVDRGEAAQAEIIRFTVEGDPIIEYVYYDGKQFYLCVDNSRDAYRGKGDAYYEARYSSMVKEEKILEGGGKTIEYCLYDGENEYSIVYIAE